ncbi:MAG: hypothetical protein LIP00_01550 [Parabacteroides sp.]|nr:hypothetical protein [Parabacteroides sp.]
MDKKSLRSLFPKNKNKGCLDIIKAGLASMLGLHYFSSKREDRLRLDIIKAKLCFCARLALSLSPE